MNILGISCFSRDTATCILNEGEIISALQEERVSRRKYDLRFPSQAIERCLKDSNINFSQIDCIACCGNKFSLTFNPKTKFFSSKDAYLASAYFPSPFENSSIFVNSLDTGVLFGQGEGNKLYLTENSGLNFSPSLIYSLVTRYLGFKYYGDEFKVMGLAAYGKPRYKGIILKYRESSPRFLPKAPSLAGLGITQFHMDVAASLQEAVEEEVLRLTEHLSKISKCDNLCLSGNMALNCLINTKIALQGNFKNIWIQPAGDAAGCAIGAAFLARYKVFNAQRKVNHEQDAMQGVLLGPVYSDNDIEGFLKKKNIRYEKLARTDIPRVVAGLIASGRIVGWFQGRSEFGPRALGNRSILGDSRDMHMQDKLNIEVKRREPFRPFAPTVLWEKAGEYFYLDKESPYMLFTAQVKEDKASIIPAVTHRDGSSRVQTLKRPDNPLYYDLLNEFYKITGCPVIINTSFNTRNEPMVLAPEDAYRCFVSSEIDCLVLGCYLIRK